jgi:hypothetical protein
METVCDLADAIKVEGAQHSHGFKIKSTPAANSDAPVNGVWFHATSAAGFSEVKRALPTKTKHAGTLAIAVSISPMRYLIPRQVFLHRAHLACSSGGMGRT